MNGTLLLVIFAVIAILCIPLILRAWVHRTVAPLVCRELTGMPTTQVALVLGASLSPDGSPTSMLYERVAIAAELYKKGVVMKLLMSGSNSSFNHDQPAVMKALAIRLGVQEEAIVLDLSGRRTYDSCYRARHTYGVERAVVITQMFHLDRALYLCKALGIEPVGVAADRQPHDGSTYPLCWLRDTLALVKAWLDVNVFRPVPL